jgi:hypothetical protein
MICFQGNLGLVYSRQAKPTSMGMKVWALCATTGYLVTFTLAKGPGKDDTTHDVVVNLARSVKDMYHVIYRDNLFTSVATFTEMLKLGVYACGTARPSRGVPEDVEVGKKDAQGTVKFKMATTEHGTITAYGWFDSGPVHTRLVHISRWNNEHPDAQKAGPPEPCRGYGSCGIEGLQ